MLKLHPTFPSLNESISLTSITPYNLEVTTVTQCKGVLTGLRNQLNNCYLDLAAAAVSLVALASASLAFLSISTSLQKKIVPECDQNARMLAAGLCMTTY